MSKILVAYFSASGMGNMLNELKPSCSKETKWLDGERFSSSISEIELENWVSKLRL